MDAGMRYGDFYLRDPEPGDAEDLLAISNDAEVMKFHGASGSWFRDVAEAAEEIEWFRGLAGRNGRRWVIARSAEDRYLGDIGFFDYDGVNRRVEVGFKLRRDCWNMGVMSSFLRQVVGWGFENRDYNRIQAYVEPGNAGSKRVLSKAGFVHEGTLREYEMAKGEFLDVEMYSLLRRELRLRR